VSRAFAVAYAALVLAPSAFAASFTAVPSLGISGLAGAPLAAAAPAALPLMPSVLPSAMMTAPALSAPTMIAPAPAPTAAPTAAPAAMIPTAALAPAARLSAAMDGPGAPNEQAKPAADAPKSAESETASSGVMFDGTATTPAAVPVEPAAPAKAARPKRVKYPLGAGLKTADSADDAWLAEVVATMGRTKTGRRVLRDIAELAVKRGNPTLVVIKAIGNNGEFRYDSDLLVMDVGHRRRAAEQTAPIMAHELQHVLQRSMGIPADAQELEIESYTVENRVWSELGVEPAAGTFARSARRRIMRDADKFIAWLNGQYKQNRPLHGGTMTAYVDWLKEKQPKMEKRFARAEKDLARAKRVAEKMRAEGKPEDAIKSFVQDDVEPVERRLRNMGYEKKWIEHDLAALSTPEGQKSFRDYSRGVIRRARALSRS
jgi:hypothetical protein